VENSQKLPKMLKHVAEDGWNGGGRPHGMTKKAESVVALPFFLGGYDGKGRKRRTMKRKRGFAKAWVAGIKRKPPKTPYH